LPLNSAHLLPHSAGVGHHGGLTPAALFGRAFVHRKIRFSPADVRTPTQERGA
jgi:hypothetical protein